MVDLRPAEYGGDVDAIRTSGGDVDEVLVKHKDGAGRRVTSDVFDARNGGGGKNSFHSELASKSPEVIKQAELPALRLDEHVNSTQKKTKGESPALSPSTGKPSAWPKQLESSFHGCQNNLLRTDAIKEEEWIWNHFRISSQAVLPLAWGGFGIEALAIDGEIVFPPRSNHYRLASSPFESTNVNYTYETGPAKKYDDNSGGDGDGGDGSQSRGPSNYDEYGDWFREHDKQWEDGGGSSGSGQSETGGGYRKPGGGYYAFASGLEDKMAKMSLK